jgi:hypothetical protein
MTRPDLLWELRVRTEHVGHVYTAEATLERAAHRARVRLSVDGRWLAETGSWRPDEPFVEEAPEELDDDVLMALGQALSRALRDRPVTVVALGRGGRSSRRGLNRIGGLPVGVPAHRWPLWRGTPMVHVLTIEASLLDVAPNGQTAAIALFVADPGAGAGVEPGAFTVVAVARADLGDGRDSRPPPAYPAERELPALELEADVVELPARELHTLAGHAGGEPSWIQPPPLDGGRFLFQFYEQLVDLNLGDQGALYVFEDRAFSQSH